MLNYINCIKYIYCSNLNNTSFKYNGHLKCAQMKVIVGLLVLWNCVILCSSAEQLDTPLTTLLSNDHTSFLNNDNVPKPAYEEFVFEHEVSRQAAIDALKTLNESFFNGPQCKIVKCTANVMTYCYGPLFINDHCLCEMGHVNEGLPFIPHNCYIGEKRHKAWAGSCFCYNQLKECCCAPALAQQWKHISGGPAVTVPSSIVLFVSSGWVIIMLLMCYNLA